MDVFWHLVEHRFLECLASLRVMLPHHGNHKKLPCLTRPDGPCGFGHQLPFGRRQRWVRWVSICLIFAQLPVALGQYVDEGEFSPAMLHHKLRLLSAQFEQAEKKLSTRDVAGSTLKKLQRVHAAIGCLEAEFQRGSYYPDQLDEDIVSVGEALRLTLADEVQATLRPPPASL